jgi:hypothetical protein
MATIPRCKVYPDFTQRQSEQDKDKRKGRAYSVIIPRDLKASLDFQEIHADKAGSIDGGIPV